jgi:hypothetical protein
MCGIVKLLRHTTETRRTLKSPRLSKYMCQSYASIRKLVPNAYYLGSAVSPTADFFHSVGMTLYWVRSGQDFGRF